MELKLDNSSMIRQAQHTKKEEVEVIYWILEDAIFDNKIDRAKSVLNILAYLAKYNKNALIDGLRKVYIDRIQEITFQLHNSDTFRSQKSVEMKLGLDPISIPFTKEKELSKYLKSNSRVLSKALGDEVKITGTEVDVHNGHKCDLVCESVNFFYPIELKIRQANHAVVSQIQKYCFHFYRKLRYDMYKPIQGIVIANGMDDWSINELRKEGIKCFSINPEPENEISLRLI